MIKTLEKPVKDLMQLAPQLQARCDVIEELRRDAICNIDSITRDRMIRHLAEELVKVVDIKDLGPTSTDPWMRPSRRYEATLFAFNEAELGVLLTRAFEAGKRA